MDFQSEEVRERVMRVFRAGQVGLCVSSVTHDINNYLGAIMAYADLLGMSENLAPGSQRMLGQISDAVQKCSSLVTSLTSIARKEKPDASVIDVPRVCAQVVEIRNYDFKVGQVDLQATYEDGIPSVIVDLPKLKMALIYLLANAFDAVQEEPESTPKTQKKQTRLQVAKTEDSIDIIVWNSGPPVPEAERERMFDPFFTTKPSPHLGLGLTLTRDIARYHGGDLTYDAHRGFILRLPRDNRLSLQQ